MSEKLKESERTKERIKLPRRYQVLIYNDDFTPMDFVVSILMTVFEKPKPEAVKLMYTVHRGSFAVAGVYVRDIAETKTAIATAKARACGYPLKLEAVPE